MTKKRFRKKLMALGVSRNRAAALAEDIGPGRSRKNLYAHLAVCLSFSGLGMTTKEASKAFGELSEAWGASVTAVKMEVDMRMVTP